MYPILKAEKLADKIYLMVVEAPRVARACEPGEFVIVKMGEEGERIPLTICDFDRQDRIPDRGSFYREDEHPQGWGCIP